MKKLFTMLCVSVVTLVAANAQSPFGIKGGLDLSTYTLGVKKASPSVNLGRHTGFFLGGVYSLQLSGKWDMQFELTYNLEGTSLGIKKGFLTETLLGVAQMAHMELPNGLNENLKASIVAHNIRIPILFKYRASEELSLMAGPYLSYMASVGVKINGKLEDLYGKDEWKDDKKDYDKLMGDNLSKFDAGLSLGVEYAFGNGMFVDLRYNLSLLNGLKKEADPSAINENAKSTKWEELIGATPKLKYNAIQVGIGYRF